MVYLRVDTSLLPITYHINIIILYVLGDLF